MSDIFQEIEEEVRRDEYAKLWKQYGDYVVAVVALLIIAVAGWQLWTRYEGNQRLKASENLIAAQQLADAGDPTRANQALSVVAKDAPSGYAEMARMTEAGVLLRSGKRDEAVQLYKEIAESDHGAVGEVARIRAGWAMSDYAPRADLETELKPLLDPKSTWHAMASEILAYAELRMGHNDAAAKAFDAIAKDKGAPDSIRRRAEVMASFIQQGGAANFGTVPKPPAPPQTAAPGAPTAPAPAAPTAPKPAATPNGKPQ